MSQSQVSQFSDNYPSSIFGDTPPDNLPFLPSDSTQSFNPDASYGQIPTSTPILNFSRQLLVPHPPESSARWFTDKEELRPLDGDGE